MRIDFLNIKRDTGSSELKEQHLLICNDIQDQNKDITCIMLCERVYGKKCWQPWNYYTFVLSVSEIKELADNIYKFLKVKTPSPDNLEYDISLTSKELKELLKNKNNKFKVNMGNYNELILQILSKYYSGDFDIGTLSSTYKDSIITAYEKGYNDALNKDNKNDK